MQAKKINRANNSNPKLIREIKYRSHVRGVYYTALVLNGIFLLASLYTAWLLYPLMPSMALSVAVSSFVLPGIFLYNLFTIFNPMAFAAIKVCTDSVVIVNKNKTTTLNYEDIKKVRFSMVPFLGGWFEFTTDNKKKFSFSTVLERCEYILQAIEKYDDQILPRNKIEKFVHISIHSDHIWARLYDRSHEKWELAFKYLLMPLLSLALYQVLVDSFANLAKMNWLSLQTLSTFAAHWAMGLTFYIFKEVIHKQKLSRQLALPKGSKTRNTRFEAKCIHFANLAYFGLSLMAAALIAWL